MKCIHRCAQQAKDIGADQRVRAVYVGLSYCMSVLESGAAGLSWLFRDSMPGGCNISLPARPLAGKRAGELLDFAGYSSLANSISLATANALFAPYVIPDKRGDITEHLSVEPGMKVGMVGHFTTVEQTILARGAELIIFELNPSYSTGVLDSSQIPLRLPECDAAVITATSIINETIDELLPHLTNCRFAGLLGPSTPLHPGCFKDTPLNCGAGVVVRESAPLAQIVMEAGGMQAFKQYLTKVNVNFN